jgi:hypothetical protein
MPARGLAGRECANDVHHAGQMRMIKTYRAGIANLLLTLLVGGQAAPAGASPAAAQAAALPPAPVVATFDDAPPLLPLVEVFSAQTAVELSAAQPKAVTPAGPPYVFYFPLIMRPAASVVTTLMSETFEGTFPGTWTLYSFSGLATGEHKWGKRTCRPMNGGYSGMSYGGGAVGGGLSCSDPQPKNIVSWMVSPTFSLVGATAAEVRYHLWQNSELNYDFFYALVSTDGTNFCGRKYSGNTEGWSEQVLDLTNVYGMGSLIGESAVQVAFVFISDFTDDGGIYYDGAFIDDLSLIRCDGGACPIAPEDGLGPLAIRGEACITPAEVGP